MEENIPNNLYKFLLPGSIILAGVLISIAIIYSNGQPPISAEVLVSRKKRRYLPTTTLFSGIKMLPSLLWNSAIFNAHSAGHFGATHCRSSNRNILIPERLSLFTGTFR